MSESESISSANSVTDRLMRWLLLSANRFAVAAVLTVGIFGIVLVFSFAGIVAIHIPDRVMWFLNGVINGLLTLIPVAVGINQIVLSQELGSLNDLYNRTEGTIDFRQRVANTVGIAVSSPQASEFFYHLFAALNDRAAALQETCDGSADEQLKDDVDDYTQTLTEQTDEISSALNETGFDLFDTLLILLDYHNSWQFYTTRRLQITYDDALSETMKSNLDELEELFLELDAARDYLKTLWVQRELAELSRMMLYTGLPAVLFAALVIFSYRNLPNLDLPRPFIVIFVSATIAVTLLPLSLLVAYMGRVALVVQRTAAFGPFIPQDEQQRISGQVKTESQISDG